MTTDDTTDGRIAGILAGWTIADGCHRSAPGFHAALRQDAPRAGAPIFIDGGHLLTIAPTGAGKGVGCVIPALLTYPGPVIVNDCKGENVAVTAARRRELGHRVVVLDPLRISGVGDDSLNPLDLIDIRDARAVDEVAALAHLICAGVDDQHNRFWLQRGTQLAIGVTLHVLQQAFERGGNERANLMTVRSLINQAAAAPEFLVNAMSTSRHPEVRRCAHLLEVRAPETLGGIIAFAQAGLDFLRGDSIARAVSSSSFELHDVTRGAPLSIYMVLPPHLVESHGRLLRVWLGTLFTAITRRASRPALDTLFLLDEAAQFGELPQLRQSITLLRGYGVRTWSFWQDASQLERLYPADWRTMINNCTAIQCFGASNPRAAREMAEITGFHDDDLLYRLPADRLLLHRAREAPLIARRPDYRIDPELADLAAPNPYHDRSHQSSRDAESSQALETDVPVQAPPPWAIAGADDRLLRALYPRKL